MKKQNNMNDTPFNKHQEYAIECFLDFFNDYLTVEKFAEHYGVTEKYAISLINEGNRLHELKVEHFKSKVKK